jgi:hypothetical protein
MNTLPTSPRPLFIESHQRKREPFARPGSTALAFENTGRHFTQSGASRVMPMRKDGTLMSNPASDGVQRMDRPSFTPRPRTAFEARPAYDGDLRRFSSSTARSF